jgi:CRISPR-associated protein Csd1
MLLQKLKEYSDRLELPPTLYQPSSVRYVVELDGEGRFLGLTDRADPTDRRARRGLPMLVPVIQRASGVKPLLLADKGDYVLGLPTKEGSAKRATQCHEAFLDLLERCASETGEPAVATVKRFLADDPLSHLGLSDDFDRSSTITFRVDGIFPVDLPAVQAFWAGQNDPAARDAPRMQCLVCGGERPVLARLQAKIKGVPGGQTAGTSIISANAGAFESYGLEASLTAPTCADCGERFTKALNDLLASTTNCVRLAGSAFVFWTRDPVDDDFLSAFTKPEPQQVRAWIAAARSGRRPAIADETRFYATVLTGSGGRTVVREWIDKTVAEVQQNLGRWFMGQEIVGGTGEDANYYGVAALAGATVRELRDVPTPTYRTLYRSALTSVPLPKALLHQAVLRNRAEQTVTRPRAALIKLVLSGTEKWEGSQMVQLAEDVTDPAYRLGRLLAVLEQIQYEAIPGVNAGVVDRFFGNASSAPGSVFPRLLQGATHHLAKIRRDKPGAYGALRGRLEDILAGLKVQQLGTRYTGFPRVLTLDQQGLFALGFFHQNASDRAARIAAAQRRAAADTTATSSNLKGT